MTMIDPEAEIEDIDARVTELVEELGGDIKKAVDFLDSAFSKERERAELYYAGKSTIPVQGNRSDYVATKVRDTIRGVKPSLLRMFLQSGSVVQYLPSNASQLDLMRQQTMFVTQEFDRAGGFRVIADAFQNAMLHKVGPVQWWWETSTETQYRSYEYLTAQQADMLESVDGVRVMAREIVDSRMTIGPDGQEMEERFFTVEIAYDKTTGKTAMQAVLLTEFIIDEAAMNGRPPTVIGRQVDMAISDVLSTYGDVIMEDLEDCDASGAEVRDNTGETRNRRGYRRGRSRKNHPVDPSMREVLITDVYWRADLDGTGIAQWYRWILGGTQRKLLTYERAPDGPNYALFQIDPKPGAVFGTSLFDLTYNDQDGLTSTKRGVIDNLHAASNPRISYHENMVNAQDMLNWDIGAPIRMRAPGMIQAIMVPFVGGQAVPFLENWENDVENKTGVSRASLGLDPRALQSTDKDAVQNTIATGQGQTEVMARNLAETGMVPLFRGLLRLAIQHQDPEQVVWLTDTRYETVDLRQFDPAANVRVNVGIGNPTNEEMIAGLERTMGLQEKIIASFGPANPVVQPHHVTAAMEDYIRLLGTRDPSRYMTTLSPEQGQEIVGKLQEAAQQPPPPDPTVVAAKEIETIRSGARMKEKVLDADLKRREKMVDVQMQMGEGARKDDLERDKMLQQLYVEAGKLVLQGGALDVSRVQAEQAATKPREN